MGATALVLGALVLWLRSGSERGPAREAPADSAAHTARPPSAIADIVEPERVAKEPLAARAEPPAHDRSILVDVVDPDGRPAAGISLACGPVSRSDPAVLDVRLRTRTDARGSARIELSELSPSGNAFRIRAELLAASVAEVELGPLAPEEHVVLRLPPTGSVRLELCDASGRETRTAVRFGVWARAEGAGRDLEPLPRWIVAPDGIALLEHVGLDLELRVAAAPEDDAAEPELVAASGPRLAGEARTISVPLGAPWPTVLARALDEHGNVLGNELLDAALSWRRPGAPALRSAEPSRPRPVRTDDEGRVRFPLRGTVAGGYSRRLVLTQRDAGGGALRSAERDLSFDAAAGAEIDLGDVVLGPPERALDAVWASGVVADHAGTPVPAATVLVSALGSDETSMGEHVARVTVDADGRFAVTGPPLEHRLSVSAVAPGWLRSPTVVVDPGASDVRISMQPAARWAGRLLLDAAIPPESVVVEVVAAAGRRRALPDSDRVVVDDLEPGLVDVEVRTRAGNWLVERREGLPTSPARSPAEARVDELDLRGRLTRLDLRLAEPDGTALDRVFARIRPEPWPEGGDWIRAGRLELVVPSDARSITVRPRGYPPVDAGLFDGVQELTCGPRIAGGA